MFPCLPVTNKAYASLANIKPLRQFLDRNFPSSKFPDFTDMRFIYFAVSMFGTYIAVKSFSAGIIPLILAFGQILQIIKARISPIFIFMVYLFSGRTWAKKGIRNKAMNMKAAFASSVEQSYSRIAFIESRFTVWSNLPMPRFPARGPANYAAYITNVTNFVKSFKPYNWLPSFHDFNYSKMYSGVSWRA